MSEKFNVLINEERLQNRIKEIARQIENDYKNEEIVLICILKGAVYFAVDLSKNIKNNVVTMDFMKVSSYGNNFETSGNVEFIMDISEDIKGKNVIVVEDIIDSGYTLNFIKKHLSKKNPKSLKLCVLLDKKERREIAVNVDYTGFEIENKFVVGYGLDYEQQYRNLPYIGWVEV